LKKEKLKCWRLEGLSITPSTLKKGTIYPMSAHELNKLDKYLKKMIAEGKIPDSESPYGAQILFVPKPDGTL